jgi:hypothetical protein
LLGAVLRYELKDRTNETPEKERGYMRGAMGLLDVQERLSTTDEGWGPDDKA